MPLNPGLLQAIGDPFNPDQFQELEREVEDLKFQFKRDPSTQILLEDRSLSPEVRQLILQREEREKRQQRAQFELNKIIAKEQDPEGRGVLSFLGPVPVGFQFGTALGIEDPVTRFMVDLVADPLNAVAGVGALTKLGRAARLLKGISPAAKARRLQKAAAVLANRAVDREFRNAINGAVLSKDTRTLRKLFETVKATALPKRTLRKLERIDPELTAFIKQSINPRLRRRQFDDLKAAFQLQDRNQKVALEAGFLDKVRKGQRSLVSFGLPLPGALGQGFDVTVPDIVAGTIDQVKAFGGLTTTARHTGAQFVGGIDVTNHVEVTNRLSEVFTQTADIMSGEAIAKTFGGDGDWATSGANFGRIMQAEFSGLRAAANEIEQLLRVVGKDNKTFLEDATRFIDNPETLESAFRLGKMSEGQVNALREIQLFLDKVGNIAVEENVLTDLVQNFIPRIIKFNRKGLEDQLSERIIKVSKRRDQAGKGAKGTAQRFGRVPGTLPRNKHSLARVFDTIDEAEAFMKSFPGQFEFKTLNVGKILNEYIASLGGAVIRNRYLRTALEGVTVEGLPLALKAGDIQQFGRRFAVRGLYSGVKNPAFSGFVFHNDIAPQVRAVFGPRAITVFERSVKDTFAEKSIRAADQTNSALKASLFNLLPFFHGMSLIMSNFALLPTRTALRNTADISRIIWNQGFRNDPDRVAELVEQFMTRSFQRADGSIANSSDVLMEMRLSSLKLGGPIEREGIGVIRNSLQSIAKAVPPPLNSPITLGLHTNEVFDRSLWEILQNGMKITAWQHIRHAEQLANPGRFATAASRQLLNDEVGQVVNQAFGGLAWERYFSDPFTRDLWRYAFVAPDWTFSNLLLARDMFLNMPGLRQLVGGPLARDVLLPDVRFRWALGYNTRAAFWIYGFGSMLNHLFTGKFLHQNEDSKLAGGDIGVLGGRIELPYNRSDGRKQFLDIGKQFLEPLRAAVNPIEFYTAKMGILPRFFQHAVIGVDGFGREIAGTEDGPYRALLTRGFETAPRFLPIPIQQAVQAARGQRAGLSSFISGFGFNIRSENPQHFRDRTIEEELRRQLNQQVSQ